MAEASPVDDRPPLVLIPGHLCDGRLYAPQRPLLERRTRLQLADTCSDDRLAAMAERLLETAPDRFALLGLSMGGMLAMEVIAQAPDRVLGAALLDTDPTPARPKERAWRFDRVTEVLAAVADGAEAPLSSYLDRFVADFFVHRADAGGALAIEIRRMMSDASTDMFARQAGCLNRRSDRTAEVRAFSGPLAVIWGADDKLCPPLVHHPIADAPNVVPTEIPDCGHISTLEAPDAVNAALAAWLDRIDVAHVAPRLH